MTTLGARCIRVKDEDTASVRRWLEGVQIVDGENAPEDAGETLPHVPQDRAKSAPCTPLRRPLLQQQYNEPSPTETAFSYDSVFDSPERTPRSPISPLAATRKVNYAETDASSVCGEELKPCTYLNDLDPVKDTHLPSPPASLNSYDPPTDDEDALDVESTGLSTRAGIEVIAPDAPRIHHLASCLQCVFAGLQCTRRTPACSRCKRKGDGEMCLLQRRRMRSEMVDGQGNFNRMPVLLKIWGCDEAVHRRKVELAGELTQAWLEREKRKNWILPINDGRLGDWKTAPARMPREHPGDGFGRTHYETLRVVEESSMP